MKYMADAITLAALLSGYVAQGYCYIMTHPCTPCMFIDHLDEQQDDALYQGEGMSLLSCIQQLAALRKRMRISDMSEVMACLSQL